MSSKPITLCDQIAQDGAKQLEGILGISLPDCATVTATKDGLRATQTDALGTHLVVEINNRGEVFRSTYCGEETRGMTSLQKNFDGSIESVPSCRDFNRVKQSGSVSLDKLAKARALLLVSKITKQNEPKVK